MHVPRFVKVFQLLSIKLNLQFLQIFSNIFHLNLILSHSFFELLHAEILIYNK